MITPVAVNLESVTDPVTRNSISKDEVRRRALLAADAAASKKGGDVVVLDVSEILVIADFFVITSGANDRQVKAIVEEVEARLKEDDGVAPARIEGAGECRWVLMDYGDFWVHVFDTETREYYDLERLWADAERVAFTEGASDAVTG